MRNVCPHCGSKDMRTIYLSESPHLGEYNVMCNNCGFEEEYYIGKFKTVVYDKYENIRGVIDDRNTREALS